MIETVLHQSDRQVGHYGRVKIYPDGYIEVMAAERPIFREAGWEAAESDRTYRMGHYTGESDGERQRGAQEPTEATAERSIRRAKARVREIALCNRMVWFVTLTLAPSEVDRYDMAAIMRRTNRWLDNQVRRHGLRYVLIPERHKDGAVHFHGFLSWGASPAEDVEAGRLIDSGTLRVPGHKKPMRPRSGAQRTRAVAAGAKVVYNLPAWTMGYSTAIQVTGTYEAAIAYVCKYIGKDMTAGKVGGRWYYSGGNLARPEVEMVDVSVEEVAEMPGGYRFAIAEAGLGMAMWRGRATDWSTINRTPDKEMDDNGNTDTGEPTSTD